MNEHVSPANSTDIEQSSVDIVFGAVVVITHNVVLLFFSLLNVVLNYTALLIRYLLQYLPPLIQALHLACVVTAGCVITVTTYCDDFIMTLCDALYHIINTTLDAAEDITVTIHHALPHYAALPLQVLCILLGWGKMLASSLLCLVSWLIPSDSETLDTMQELYIAICDLGGVVGVISLSVMSQCTELIFSTLLSLITSAKYVAHLIIRVLQISCCQILPTMLDTCFRSLCLVCWYIYQIPQHLLTNLQDVFIYFEEDIQLSMSILYSSLRLISSTLLYSGQFLSQVLYLLFRPIVSLITTLLTFFHSLFSTFLPGGLVTLIIGLFALWKWYNPSLGDPPPPRSPPPPLTPPVTPDVPELQDQLDSEREQRLCVICTDTVKSTVLLPCKHCCVCTACSVKLLSCQNALCPLCRQSIRNTMKIYL